MTVVGLVEYDVRLNLSQLKKDTALAEKIVKDSYKKNAQAQKAASKVTTVGGSTSGGGGTTEAEMRVKNLKRQAEETYSTIAKYTPQIQRQFLGVERANNQVYNATTRSSAAIQKYGNDSVQAQRATNSLNVAVQNQAIAQTRLDTSLKNTGNSFAMSKAGTVALTASVAALGLAIASNLGGAISRSDTLNNFPLVMSNLKIGTEDSSEVIQTLAERLRGLPTSLDSAAQSVQRFTAVNKNVKASSAFFLALNNAVLAGGASADIQATAIEQLSQSYSKGRVDMVEWRALLTAMPAQLEQVAQAMGFISADALGEELRTGKTSVDDFLLTISRLNTEGANGFSSFETQARNATGGIGTSVATLGTAIQRSITTIIDTFGRDNIKNSLDDIGNGFESTANLVSGLIRVLQPLAPVLGVVAGGFGIYTAAVGLAALGTRGLNVAMLALAKHPIIAALSLIAAGAIAVAGAMGAFDSETKDTTDSADDLSKSLEGYEAPIRGATDAAGDLANQMAKIDEQITKANEDYRYQLAELVADKNKNIANLQKTLGEEEKAYNEAYQERLASFNKAQNEEELSHADKTKELQNQINFLSKYNNAANKQQVSELQFSLAQENAAYQKSTALRVGEFDKQTQAEFSQYELRRQENQKKLDDELALLNKHREDVLAVRGVILRDEIESLKQSRDEQIKSLEQQRNEAASKGAQTGAGYAKAFNAESSKILLNPTDAQKDQIAKNFRTNVLPFLEAGLQSGQLGKTAEYKRAEALISGRGYADGGFTGQGGKNQAAGIVHKGEYVLPKEMVNQSTGMPKAGAGGAGSVTNNVFNLSGIMASGKSDLRAIANQLGKLMNETSVAKTGKIAIGGI